MKYLFPLFLILTMGCSKGISYRQFLVWYESDKNPLRKKQVIGDIEYTCTYMTTDYFKARDIAAGSNEEDKSPDESEYYKVNIKIKDGIEPLTYHAKDKTESFERINYLVSCVNDDILLISGAGDTLSCQLHHYERVYHVGNTLSVLFIFDKTKEEDTEKSIVFYDRLFGNGLLTFTFSKEETENIPKLKN